ncbi:GNAT family N-acetyltransferase [Nordella sp. HKS 07]|uniref:GNAT family N-acetyltransferase n=1 Tax=Nordella sp. HKS 07 TaxID=2712222 RepID=UPI0013E10ACD|nr:GNAT family N-acetyltransferase [Nordella sp. HKS 07]
MAAKRDLRLAALKESSAAFASSLDRELDRSEAEWRAWPRDGAYFAAFDDSQSPIGIAGCWIQPGPDPVAHLISMWVAPSARRAGVDWYWVSLPPAQDQVTRLARLAASGSRSERGIFPISMKA